MNKELIKELLDGTDLVDALETCSSKDVLSVLKALKVTLGAKPNGKTFLFISLDYAEMIEIPVSQLVEDSFEWSMNYFNTGNQADVIAKALRKSAGLFEAQARFVEKEKEAGR